ncbi:MAG: polysaccharide biosynthesis/export family protein [Phycisphaerae bacterium]
MKSLLNSWLEPTAVGDFDHEGTTEIRTTLSIQDAPGGIPGASDPLPEDLVPSFEEYRFGPGDTLSVRILELMARGTETQVNVPVDEMGNIRIPVVGALQATGLTSRELEQEIADYLDQKGVLRDAEVIIEPVVRRNATVNVFGAIAAPNLYPVPTPDYKLLEALNVAGGLSDIVTDIFVFREEGVTAASDTGTIPPDSPTPEAASKPTESAHLSSAPGLSSSYGAPALAARQEPSAPESGPSQTDQDLPSDDDRPARQELMDAIAPTQSQPVEQPSQDQAGELAAEPAPPQSRWIFLNGKWIEVEPPVPASAPTSEPADTGKAGPPEYPALPQPSVDWSKLAGETRNRVIRVSAEELRNGDPRQNIIIRPGDTVRVMSGEIGEYYIMGQINRPGAYGLSGRQLTLKAAIAAAGNLGALAWPQRCTIYRRLGDREEMIQVDVDRIFAGKDPDFFIKRNDLIVFGTHPASIFLAVLRNAFRITYGFGFVYDRNFADVDITRRQVRASVSAQQDAQNRFQGLFP